jgi:spore coat protein U-like protein
MRTSRLALLAVLWTAAAAWPSTALADCSVSVQGGLGFGAYDVFSTTPLDTTGTVAYRCENKDHGIRITLGRGSSPTFRPRMLVNGSDGLAYNLFLDAGRTLIWGDQAEGTQAYTIHNPPNNQWIELTIYGRIPAGQDVGAGAYSDTITIAIDF